MSARRQIRVSDLPETYQYGVYLYCPGCGGQYSADRGDYFMAAVRNPVLKCGGKGHGGPTRNLILVRKTTIIEEISG